MLDFNHVLNTPGVDIQYFEAPAQSSLLQWQTWRKPRGAKWIYMLGVGGAGGGGCGINTSTSSGGGSGGSSGAQAIVMIPAMFVPDLLYVQCGIGGPGGTTSGAVASAGTDTYVAISTTSGAGLALADTILRVPGASIGNAGATTTTGGTATNGAANPTIGNMPLAGRGFYTLIGGQIGAAGGSSTTAGVSTAYPTTGLMVTGGGGGGGTSSSAGLAGGAITAITGPLGNDFFQLPIAGGSAGVTTTPATPGRDGFKARNELFHFGGSGGGGASATAGGIAAAGGNGAPGCGGGGGGGASTTNSTVAPGGNGGNGFVYIITF